MKAKIKIGVSAGFIIALIAPVAFTRPACRHYFDFSNTGEIGDTIGGITAPIIGIISILLLVYTLWEQINFNKKQIETSSDEQFKSSFFNLLQTQRDILLKVSGTFSRLNKPCTTSQSFNNNGVEFFQQAKMELSYIFFSLNNDKYYNKYDSKEAYSIIESIQEQIIIGHNLPEDIETENEKVVRDAQNPLIIAYTNDIYGITPNIFRKYKGLSIEKKIELGYAYFFNKYEIIGYYFRHLYRILTFIKQNEDAKISQLEDSASEDEKKKIHNDYSLYAQFIQAQMSTDELLLTFYNSFTFPKAQKLLIHYNLLENLTIQNLINIEHNCNEKLNLKDKRDIFRNILK